MSKNQIAYLLLILPPLFWSGNFVVGRAIAEEIPAIGLAFWRWVAAGLILLPFAIGPLWRQRDIIKQHFWKILVLAATDVSAYNTLAYLGLQSTTATNATLLNSLIPIFILLLSKILYQTKASKAQLLGIMISLIGVVMILTKMDLGRLTSLSFNRGDLWVLLAGLDWALYSILLKNYKPKELESISFLAISIILGTLLLLPIYLLNPFNEQAININQDFIYTLCYVAIFPSLVAYFAWNYGIAQVGANLGGQFIHLMPIFGAILAMVFLGESLHSYHFFGGAAIAFGLMLSLELFSQKKYTGDL